ncbi:MlaD family protein [Pseudaestuariivita sp.]|uniref:MlaD family protein n=1 Tax=Pseudaestuariivita sp. TaxID=2211669 RepID=UPI0040580C3E
MSDDIPEAPRAQGTKRKARGASVVWLVPLAALCVAIFVAWTTYADRGPVIRIAFEDAGGILPNETELRFRNVPVGVVEEVAFNADLTRVLVDVRLDKGVAPFVDEGAEFWVVRPEVSTSGVTGLQTVLSGVYIAGNWDDEPGGTSVSYLGRDAAPLVTAYRSGTLIELRSTRSQGLSENKPIVYKGIEVGRVGTARISQDGDAVVANAIIYEDHVRLVSSATRFWDTSGFSFSLGPNGAELDFSSLASLVSGGITFDTLVSGGTALEEGMSFAVFRDQSAARNSVFEENDGETLTVRMVFEENVSGLAAGAPVEWRGLRIGEVVSVSGIVDEARFGDARVRLLATVDVRPARFGLGRATTTEEAFDYLERRVANGLRARLATASILTGGLKIEFVVDPDATEDTLDRNAEPFPIFPVTAGDIADVSATADGVLQRVSALPFEELLDSTIAFLNNATALVSNQSLQNTPAELLGLVTDARGVVSSDAVQALPADIQTLVTDLQSASGDLSALLSDLREANTAERLLAAIDQAGLAAEAVTAGLAGLPDLTERATTLLDTANTLPLVDLVTEAGGVATELRTVLASDATQALPATAVEALGALQTLLADLNEAGTAASLSDALTRAGEAATAVETAMEGVPELIEGVNTLVATANTLPLQTLIADAQGLAVEARALLSSEATRALPASATAAITELETLLSGLNEANTAQTLSETLVSAGEAATAVETSVAGLPGVVEELDTFVTNANTLALDELVRDAQGLAAEARRLFAAPALQTLPASVSGAVAELDTLLTGLTEANTAQTLETALVEAASAAEAVELAVEGIPGIITRIDTIAARAEEVPLDELAAELELLLNAATRLIGDTSEADLPDALASALSEAEAAIADLRAGGLIDSANATMASARRAASAIEDAAGDLPALVSRLSATLTQAQSTLAGFDGNSNFNRQTTQALREVERAAKAVSDLARTLNRRPNSLILGR